MTITPYVPPSYLSSLPSGIWSGAYGLPVFPWLPGKTPKISKTQTWATNVSKSSSGRVRRTALWPYPLWAFEVGYEVLRHEPTLEELNLLWEFFGVMQGQFGTFLFVDPSDCEIQSGAAVQFGVGDGSTRTFQLMRQVNSFVEPVYGSYSPTILDNGVVRNDVTFNANGVVTFATAPVSGHALTWFGYFYFGCMFQQDGLSFTQIVNLLWNGKSLKFTSLRV